jgi:RNA polymerase sigma factor (sigma-70 family)
MVLGVCRRVLGDLHAAEDAFQATFLVLARKAPSLVSQELVGNWLWGVALRTARRAKADAARWHSHNREVHKDMALDPVDEVMWRDLRPVLDEEMARLPAKYRQPFVLCYLLGKTNEDAARRLGCPSGTVFTRLARAREILRSRLTRRGVTLSAAVFVAALTQEASARVPEALARSTVRAAALFAIGSVGATGTISPRAAKLAEGALRAVFVSKLKVAAATLFALATLGTAGTLYTQRVQANAVDQVEREEERSPASVVQPPRDPKTEPQSRPPDAESRRRPLKNAGTKQLEVDKAESDSSDEEAGFGMGFGMGSDSATATVNSGGRSIRVTVRGSSRLAALSQPAVLQELGLTDKQLDQVRKLQTRQQNALQGIVPHGPVTARQAPRILRDMERVPQRIGELAREIDTAIDALLSGKQRQRLREITLQQRQGDALDDLEVAEALKLTAAQRDQLREIRVQEEHQMRQLQAGQRSARASTSIPTLREQTGERLLRVLTPDQKTKWLELTGKPFTMKRP